ncbi:MAG: hypothetical protein M3069_18220 [Chloroflexota bacterium]|nr:hypothetical protein [Chloroflexota bacterium]
MGTAGIRVAPAKPSRQWNAESLPGVLIASIVFGGVAWAIGGWAWGLGIGLMVLAIGMKTRTSVVQPGDRVGA